MSWDWAGNSTPPGHKAGRKGSSELTGCDRSLDKARRNIREPGEARAQTTAPGQRRGVLIKLHTIDRQKL